MSKIFPKAYILAGGRSNRFPGDKALVEIAGQPQLLRLQQRLLLAGHQVHVVADRHDRFASLGMQCIPDFDPQSGPLGGILTALKHYEATYEAGWILVLGCDQFSWHDAWSLEDSCLESLAKTNQLRSNRFDSSESNSSESNGNSRNMNIPAQTTSPSTSEASQPEPSAALWPSQPFSPIPGYFHTRGRASIEALWQQDRRAMKDLLSAAHFAIHWLPRVPKHPREFSFNSPDQLQRLLDQR